MSVRSPKLPPLAPAELTALDDAALAERLEEELSRLTPRARDFVMAWGSGTPALAAARQAKFKTTASVLYRLRRRVDGAVRCLREQVRRTASLTLEQAVQGFREVYAEARAAKDYSAAARALREAALLVGLYPETRVKLQLDRGDGQALTTEEWEALAQLRHQVRRLESAPVVEVQALPASPALPNPSVGASGTTIHAGSEVVLAPLTTSNPPAPIGGTE